MSRTPLFIIVFLFVLLNCITFYILSGFELKTIKNVQSKNDTPLVFYYIWTTGPERYGELHRKCLESVLFHHPNSSFRIYSTSLPPNFFSKYSQLGYDIRVHPLNYNAYFKGSRLLPLLSKVRRSEYAYSHLTDLFRFHTLWKKGGVYLDTDIFLLKSLDPLCKTIPFSGVIGIQEMESEDNAYNGAVLCFPEPHHPFLNSVIKRALKEYNPEDWTSFGPKLLSRTVRTYPRTLRVKTFTKPNSSMSKLLLSLENRYISRTRFSSVWPEPLTGFLITMDRVEYFYPRHWSKSLLDVQDDSYRLEDYSEADVEEKEWFNLTHISYANHIATHFWPLKVKNGSVPKNSFLGRMFRLIPRNHFLKKRNANSSNKEEKGRKKEKDKWMRMEKRRKKERSV